MTMQIDWVKTKAKAMLDYDAGDKIVNIANRYHISTAVISVWAKKTGRALRQQGRRIGELTRRHWDIFNDYTSGKYSLSTIGRRHPVWLPMWRLNAKRLKQVLKTRGAGRDRMALVPATRQHVLVIVQQCEHHMQRNGKKSQSVTQL